MPKIPDLDFDFEAEHERERVFDLDFDRFLSLLRLSMFFFLKY